MEGWIAISNTNGQITSHYIRKNNSTLCSRYKDVAKVSERIIESKNGIEKCSVCFRNFEFYQKHGITKTELNERKTHPNVHKSFETSDNKTSIIVSDDTGSWTETRCPDCRAKVVFWNSRTKTHHNCTECGRIVELPMEVILA